VLWSEVSVCDWTEAGTETREFNTPLVMPGCVTLHNTLWFSKAWKEKFLVLHKPRLHRFGTQIQIGSSQGPTLQLLYSNHDLSSNEMSIHIPYTLLVKHLWPFIFHSNHHHTLYHLFPLSHLATPTNLHCTNLTAPKQISLFNPALHFVIVIRVYQKATLPPRFSLRNKYCAARTSYLPKASDETQLLLVLLKLKINFLSSLQCPKESKCYHI